jgi:hypothetical protein
MTDTKPTRVKRMCGPNNEYLFCSTEKLDDPDGSWFKAFCKEATEHGCTVWTTGPMNGAGDRFIYVTKGTNWVWTGVCPKCNRKAVTGGRCVQCGWDSGVRHKTAGYTIPGGTW